VAFGGGFCTLAKWAKQLPANLKAWANAQELFLAHLCWRQLSEPCFPEQNEEALAPRQKGLDLHLSHLRRAF